MKKIIVGISGASGFIYGFKTLQILKQYNVETHLIITKAADIVRQSETNISLDDLYSYADYLYNNNDLTAIISSGSFKTDGMIIAPCSIKTLSSIANSITDNLLIRSADVTLKERRKLVLMLRETPLHIGHMESMLKVSNIGAIIYPPVPAFYAQPKTIDDIVVNTISKMLDLFDICMTNDHRWKGIL